MAGTIPKILLLPITLMLASCGMTISEIGTADDGTYVISGKGYAREENNLFPVLYEEANAYCAKQGKVLKPIACEGDFKPLDSTRAKLTFRCLSNSAPEER